jgi:hypothetical protein
MPKLWNEPDEFTSLNISKWNQYTQVKKLLKKCKLKSKQYMHEITRNT